MRRRSVRFSNPRLCTVASGLYQGVIASLVLIKTGSQSEIKPDIDNAMQDMAMGGRKAKQRNEKPRRAESDSPAANLQVRKESRVPDSPKQLQ